MYVARFRHETADNYSAMLHDLALGGIIAVVIYYLYKVSPLILLYVHN